MKVINVFNGLGYHFFYEVDKDVKSVFKCNKTGHLKKFNHTLKELNFQNHLLMYLNLKNKVIFQLILTRSMLKR